jgi:hypothetical protein
MLGPAAQQIIDRLARRVDDGTFDAAAIEKALKQHFAALGVATRGAYWAKGGLRGYVTLLAFLHQSPREFSDWYSSFGKIQKAAKRSAFAAMGNDDPAGLERWLEVQRLGRWSVWQVDGPARGAGDAAWRAMRRMVEKSFVRPNVSRIRLQYAADYAAEAVAALAASEVFDDAAARKWVEVSSPLIDAYEAGLFLYQVHAGVIICVPRPRLHETDHRLHREDGPAVEWPREQYWFWRDEEVTRRVIEAPSSSIRALLSEPEAAARRAMIAQIGAERLVRETDGHLIDEDTYGRLWHCQLGRSYAILEVENGTIGTDGLRSRHFLWVPSDIWTAREAVAWTYGLAAQDYELAVRT